MVWSGVARSVVRAICWNAVVWSGLGLCALKAAGLTGTAPSGSSAITQLVATLTSNWEWLIGTGVGLVLMLIAGLMMFGSQRAPDHLFRVIGAIMLILIVIPAILA
jgi:hypothetical protein